MEAGRREEGKGPWVFYDGHCPICTREVNRWKKTFHRFGFKFVPQQTDWVQRFLGLENGQAADEMKLVTHDGRLLGGFDAVLHLAGLIWWVNPFVWILRIPGVFHIGRAVYRQVAKRRYCFKGTCELP